MPSTRDVPPTPVNQAVDTRTYFKARPTSGPSPDTGPDSDRMVHRALPEPLASKVDNAEKVELKVAEPPGVTPNTAARGGDVVQAAPSAVRSPQITQHAAVAQQVVQAMVSADGQDVEIRLSPEELGTVRIVMAPREAGVHVTIYADRPETLDLLRRGEAEFSADLQDQGFEQSTFTFSQGATDESDTDRSSPGDMELPTAAMDPERPLAGVSDRLDLRV